MTKRAQYLTEDQFWQIITDARKACDGDDDALPETISEKLASESLETIWGFDYHFWRFHARSYTSELWAAGYVAMGGCSDDAFDYFRGWLIGQGKEIFEASMQHPDAMLPALEALAENGGFPENEMMLGAANSAYEIKTGKDDFFEAKDTFTDENETYPELIFTWEEDDEDSQRRICPKIWERFSEDPF